MTEQTEARIRAIIAERLAVPEENVKSDTLLVPANDGCGNLIASDQPNLGADSLDIVDLTMSLEDEFDIQVSDDDQEALNRATVQGVYDLVERLTGPVQQAA